MGASTKAMIVDYEYCLGCSDCELACMAERDVGPEKMGIKVVRLGPWRADDGAWQYDFMPIPTDWCNLCLDRTQKGGQAACVRHCSYNVISCGEVDDLIASVKMKPKMTLFTIRSK